MIGIDWVAVAILLAAYGFSQIRTVPLRARHGVFALACFIIAAWRMRTGAAGNNLIFVGLAVALGLFYAVQAIRTKS